MAEFTFEFVRLNDESTIESVFVPGAELEGLNANAIDEVVGEYIDRWIFAYLDTLDREYTLS